MKNRKVQIVLGFVFILLLAMGCGENVSGQNPTPTVEVPHVSFAPEMTPTEKPVPSTEPTEVPGPTPTPEPTATNVPTQAIEPTAVPTATGILQETPTPTPMYTYRDIEDTELWTTTKLNMRDLPGTEGNIIDCAEKDSKVLAIRQCNETGWYEVEYNGKTGYMSGKYLTTQAPPTPTPVPTKEPLPAKVPADGRVKFLIAIDPGHQRKGNYDTEPNGPGSDTMKAKVSSGTQGVYTGLWEYELNLSVSLMLRDELIARGYDVIMTRETHDIDISNVERALIANEANVDAFIRVHANSSSNTSANGIETLCQTKKNPYNGYLYAESRLLSELVLEEVVEETGAHRRYILETDTMTGINWTTVPTTILEMGYMSNKKEDELMATEEYQKKIVKGVADALDRYFGRE